jgi:hypothetical protein
MHPPTVIVAATIPRPPMQNFFIQFLSAEN